MKNIIIAATLCAASITPAIAQTEAPAKAPEAPKVAVKGTNDLALLTMSHFKAVFNHAATADNEENAKKAALAIDAELVKLGALKPLFEKAKAPTDAEMAIIADKMAGFEVEMKEVITKMTNNMMTGGPAVQQAIGPAMQRFGAKTQDIGKLMEDLYPREKMTPLLEAAKEKAQAKEKAKLEKEAPKEEKKEEKKVNNHLRSI